MVNISRSEAVGAGIPELEVPVFRQWCEDNYQGRLEGITQVERATSVRKYAGAYLDHLKARDEKLRAERASRSIEVADADAEARENELRRRQPKVIPQPAPPEEVGAVPEPKRKSAKRTKR